MTIYSNLDAVGSLVGSYEALANRLDSDDYLNKVIDRAHGKARSAFDIAAAASARLAGFSHMYEFGTPGVTEGTPKFNARSQEAQLWRYVDIDMGRTRTSSFVFRPAINRNPRPTTKSTGVSQKVLSKLSKRKYVFRQKAFIIEMGKPVINKSNQDHGLLFIPFYGQSPTGRTYMMWNTKVKGNPRPHTPGINNKGKFTAFWLSWWAKSGVEIMEQDANKKVYDDAYRANERAAKRAGKQRPSLVRNTMQIENARRKAFSAAERENYND